LHERLPADPTRLAGVRRTVRAWAVQAALPEDTADDLQLALGEALANAVEHAYAADGSGECEYSATREADGGVRVRVQDAGTWRPPPSDKGHRGRGLELIEALTRDVEVTSDPGAGSGTMVTFRLAPGNGGAGPAMESLRSRGAAPDGVVEAAAAWAATATPAGVSAHEEATGVRWEVTGELDLATVGSVRAALLARLDTLPAGVEADLDLGSITYLASAGVGMVLQLLTEAADRGVRLRLRVGPGTPAARVLALAGVGDPVTGEADHRGADIGRPGTAWSEARIR
jgi:anti-anti-sigma factor